MRLLILYVALTALVIASCGPRENITNSNSGGLSATRTNNTSGPQPKPRQPCLNLNIATAEELIRLPGIGEVMAKRIIDYRERHGRFRRPEEIIIIEGFSERKYRAIAGMVCVE
jgi:competence protein ComEA